MNINSILITYALTVQQTEVHEINLKKLWKIKISRNPFARRRCDRLDYRIHY